MGQWPTDFNLDFYAEVQDLKYLENSLSTGSSRYASLNMAICQLIEDFSLVGFETLAVEVCRADRIGTRINEHHLIHVGSGVYASSHACGRPRDGVHFCAWSKRRRTPKRGGYEESSSRSQTKHVLAVLNCYRPSVRCKE